MTLEGGNGAGPVAPIGGRGGLRAYDGPRRARPSQLELGGVNSWNSDSGPAQRSGTRRNGSGGAWRSLTCKQGERLMAPLVN